MLITWLIYLKIQIIARSKQYTENMNSYEINSIETIWFRRVLLRSALI